MEAEYCDIPPLLPAKKGTIMREDTSESPPPLPAKKGANAAAVATTTAATFVDDFSLAGGMS